MLGKINWAMKGWSKIIRKCYHTEVNLTVGNIYTQYRAKFKSKSWAVDTVYVYKL